MDVKVSSIRWDNDLHKKIVDLAKKENRTFATMVKNIIIRFFAREGK